MMEGRLVNVRVATPGERGLVAFHAEREQIVAGSDGATGTTFIVLKDDKPIGAISVFWGHAPRGTCGLAGLVFDKADRQHGYMLEAFTLVIATIPPEFVRLEICAASDNFAAREGAKRLGFEHEGILRSWYPRGDANVDAALYSKVRV